MQNHVESRVELSPFVAMRHANSITLLTLIINNVDTLKNGSSVAVPMQENPHLCMRNSLQSYYGLCSNAELSMYNCKYLSAIIANWARENNPLFGTDEYFHGYFIRDDSEYDNAENLWANPLRLHAAIFIRNALIDLLAVAEIVTPERTVNE